MNAKRGNGVIHGRPFEHTRILWLNTVADVALCCT